LKEKQFRGAKLKKKKNKIKGKILFYFIFYLFFLKKNWRVRSIGLPLVEAIMLQVNPLEIGGFCGKNYMSLAMYLLYLVKENQIKVIKA
jgi:hypothetical protein